MFSAVCYIGHTVSTVDVKNLPLALSVAAI